MATSRPTQVAELQVERVEAGSEGSEWTARALRPVAHWVRMPTAGGRDRLEMVWEVPDPLPPAFLA